MSMSYRQGWLKFLYSYFIWPLEAILLGLLIGLLTISPLRVASFVMGRLFARLGPVTPWHKRAEDQMKLALPEYSKAERQIWLSEMWENLGRTAAEFIKTRQMLNKGYIQFEGLHHLTDHDGGFVIGAHLGNWEALSMLGPCTNVKTGLIYRPLNNPYVSRLMKRRTYSANADIYEKGRQAAIGMVSTLRKGGFMLLLVDQQLREGETVPFFGYPAKTAVAHIKLAAKTGKPIFMAQTVRGAGCNIKVFLSAPIYMQQTANDKDCREVAKQINQQIETWIRQHPGQWLWPHRRWGKIPPAQLSK